MNDLIISFNDNFVTTQNQVSQLTENDEESIQKLIRTYKEDLEEFGKLEFFTINSKNSKNKINIKKSYYLNEQQATLLLTYMRNSLKVRKAKKILVSEFYRLNNKSHHHQILGYKSQLSQKNKKIKLLENQIKLLPPIDYKKKYEKQKDIIAHDREKMWELQAFKNKVETALGQISA